LLSEEIPVSLLTSQRNYVFTAIQDSGLDPTDFDITESLSETGRKTVNLTQKTTGFYFQIQLRPVPAVSFRVSHSPGAEFLTELSNCSSWTEVTVRLGHWLSYVLRETAVPDLWDKVMKEGQLIQDATEQKDNAPFSQAELPKVRSALEEIKVYVTAIKDFSEEQRRIINARFDYMEEAASRMGRKDWINIVISNLLGIAFTLAFNGDSTRDLFRFAGEVFRRTLGTILYLVAPH
jgi:hypothetical protein